jgi:hypothetical protein
MAIVIFVAEQLRTEPEKNAFFPRNRPNQSMKPTAPLPMITIAFVTKPAFGLSLSR